MKILAADSETHLIQPGLLTPPPVCWSFCQDGLAPWLLDKDRGATALEYAFELGTPIVGANVAYDLGVLAAYRPHTIPAIFKHYDAGLVFDVRIRQELLDIAAGRRQMPGGVMVFRGREWVKAEYSLAALEKLHLGIDRSAEKTDPDAWRLRYAELENTPIHEWPEAARSYALADASGTLAVFTKQGGDITNEQEQCRAAWALHLMSTWGVRTDGTEVKALEEKLLKLQAKNAKILRKINFQIPTPLTAEDKREGRTPDFVEEPKTTKAGVTKPGRPMKFKRDMEAIQAYVERVYQRRGKKAPTTGSGRISTDKDTLIQSGSRILRLLADGGGVDKLLQTYVPVLKQGTEVPINARFNVLVNSGRTSCAKPNLQNLPSGRRLPGVRECFVPRPNFLYTSVDYDTLELRALAQVCLWLFGKSEMAEAIRAGKDLHLHMAANMLGIEYPEAVKRHRAKDPALKKARDAAKVANFGFPGGLGSDTLVDYARVGYGVVLSKADAAALKRDWLKTWPEMERYFAYISQRIGFAGEADIVQFVSKRVRGGVGFCDGCNTFFQGLAADGAKRACYQVAKECYVDCGTALYGSRPVVFVHDELILEVPADLAHEASSRLATVMCKAMAEYISDLPITASPALMSRWHKNAEAVYHEGRLVPWEPKPAVASAA